MLEMCRSVFGLFSAQLRRQASPRRPRYLHEGAADSEQAMIQEGRRAHVLVGLTGVYIAGSLLLLACARLRSSPIFRAVPTYVGMAIIGLEAATFVPWLYASVDGSFESAGSMLEASSAAYILLIGWLFTAALSDRLDGLWSRVPLGLAVLVLLWIGWSVAFSLAFMHATPEQRPWMFPHLVHRTLVDGAWTIAAVRPWSWSCSPKPVTRGIRF